ncbi:MAG: EAL domain-containing protein [Pseudomonadales bacterium]
MEAKVLIADDSLSCRSLINDVLSDMDVTIELAEDGVQAYTKAMRHEFAVIILDVVMPNMDGVTCAKKIHQEINSNIPIILVTGLDKEGLRLKESAESGVIDYLIKPINTDLLINKVRAFVELFRSHKNALRTLESVGEDARYIQSIIDAVPDPIIVCDNLGQFSHFNYAFKLLAARFSGHVETDAVGLMSFLDIYSEDDVILGENETPLARALATCKTVKEKLIFRSKVNREVGVWSVVASPLSSFSRSSGAIITMHDVTELVASKDRTEYLSKYDILTGLSNRNHLEEKVSIVSKTCERKSVVGALLFLDIDDFKLINDALGHSMGDKVIVAVADGLKNAMRSGELLFRFGSDEFILLVPEIANNESEALVRLSLLVDRIMKLMSKDIYVDGVNMCISCSIGVAFIPKHGTDVENIIRRADSALYVAKDNGKGNMSIFDEAIEEKVNQNFSTLIMLREAIENDRFRIHIQPQFDAVGLVIGGEALLRIEQSNGDLIYPNQFIEVMERSGLVVEIGYKVLSKCCELVRKWRLDGNPCFHIPLSVNVSAIQFARDDFVEHVKDIFTANDICPGEIYFEITESVSALNNEKVISTLQELRALGVSIALDDFGTGYSSLAYLSQMPIDIVKIDQSFINQLPEDVASATIVGAIIEVCKAFNLKVIAEGVETLEQANYLIAVGCNQHQGYYYAKPMSSFKFQEYLTTTCLPKAASRIQPGPALRRQ